MGKLISCLLSAILLTACSKSSMSPSPVTSSSAPIETTGPTPSKNCCENLKMKQKKEFRTRLTSYYPDSSALEGGFNNRYGKPLQTLQYYLSGKSEYVSTAIDKNLGRVKRVLCIPELDEAYGKNLKLITDDTGGAFTGRGYDRLDICTANKSESLKKAVNQTVTAFECE